MVRAWLRLLSFAFGLAAVSSTTTAAGAGPAPTLMRFPNTSTTSIAFVACGALWTVPLAGGIASRLTAGSHTLLAPHFSPDGQVIAFTREHAGAFDVFAVPAAGGLERRLTFDAPTILGENLVVGWTPDGKHVVFLSKRASSMFRINRAFTVPVGGGLAEPLSLDRSGLLSYGPGGHTVAFNRFFRNFDTRKRYLGGQHQNVFTYDFATRDLVRMSDWKGTDTSPMWFGRTIYILSDRDAHFRANIWAIDMATKAAREITHFTDFDIDWPSLGGHTITFQQGGRLWAIDLPSERLRHVDVTVPDDRANTAARGQDVGGEARVDDATGGIDYAVSPDGGAVLLSAHGDIFRVGSDGRAENLTSTPGADEDHPSWSADGRTVSYETDRTGEQQLAVRPAASGRERLLTRFATGTRDAALWSPRGDWLALPDANHALWLVPAGGGAPRLVARDGAAEIRDASFSPDGTRLTYSATNAGGQRQIHVHDIASGRDTVVSSPMESDRDPVFSPDGTGMVFVSQRRDRPFVSDRDDATLGTLSSDGLYVATFAPGGGIDGLMARAVALPTAPASILALDMRGTTIFYETSPPVLLDGGLLAGSTVLHALDLRDRSDRVVVTGLSSYSLSADGSRVVFRRDGAWHFAPTRGGGLTAPADTTLPLAALRATVDPPREWAEMFDHAWRLDRDVFFSAATNGDNWRAVHDHYAELLPLLGSRDDFLYLLDQMVGELASSHARVEPGVGDDGGTPDVPEHLGVDLALDPASGLYRIAHIERSDDTRPELGSPLAAAGIRTGELLLAIDGHALRAPIDPDRLLLNSGTTAILTLGHASTGATRDVTVHLVHDEMPLRHHDWIERARARVAAMSGGRLGYVYLSDLDAEGAADFVRQFYPQASKRGLVIDIRWNRGGFLSQAVLDVLQRAKLGLFVNRENNLAPLPAVTPPKVLVCVINEGTASDGDQFAYYFRRLGLGPLVGTRTWGGVQGINGPWSLMDGTAITIPKDSLADLDGHWLIENTGVAPDVLVEDRPDEDETDTDAQLSRATALALTALRRLPQHPLAAPPPLPAYPAAGNVPGASFGP